MKLPDYRSVSLAAGVLAEPTLDDSRLVLWRRDHADAEFEHWECIGTVFHAQIEVENGICTTAAVSFLARRRLRGLLGLDRFRSKGGGRTWLLPGGQSAEQYGGQQANLLLAWSEEETAALDEARIKSHWPDCDRVEKLGKNLFVIRGVRLPEPPAATAMTDETQANEFAEQMLAQARQRGDCRQEAAALADLGVLALNKGEFRRAVELLRDALAMIRQLQDRSRETDVLANLGLAVMELGEIARAVDLLHEQVAIARAGKDPHAEKLGLENLAIVHVRRGDRLTARPVYAEALAVARQVNDLRHQADLLWHLAIQDAELGNRADALTHAQEAVALMRQIGKPEAEWYADHLAKFQRDENAPALRVSGTISPWTSQPVTTPAAAPSFLRMAVKATKALAQFVASRGKRVTPEARQARLDVCATCEHHTALRCRLCGCFTHIKSWLPYEECPAGKWPR